MNRSRLINVVGIAIGVAGGAFVARRIVRDRSEIADALSSANPAWLVIGGITGLLAMGLIGVNWLLVLRHGGAAAPWRRGMSWFFVGQLGKYVPGGIWPIVGQAELAHRDSTPRRVAYSSTAMSMVATFLGAATVAAVSGLLSPSDGRLVPAAIAVGLVLTFGALMIPAARSPLDRLAQRVTKKQLRLPDPRWFSLLVVRHLPVWVSFAGMNIFAVAALGADLDASLVVELVFVTCVSWMAGFVVVGVPGGIGIRETIFISMTTAPLGAGVAVSAAVLSRVVSTVTLRRDVEHRRCRPAPRSGEPGHTDHPDPLLQRGGDPADDAGRPSS
jgi:hypothetical protein